MTFLDALIFVGWPLLFTGAAISAIAAFAVSCAVIEHYVGFVAAWVFLIVVSIWLGVAAAVFLVGNV